MSEEPGLELAAEARLPAEKKRFWGRLRRGLSMTHTELIDKIGAAVDGRTVVDEETLDYLEEALIGADVGVETAVELVDSLREGTRGLSGTDAEALRQRLVDEMAILLLDAPRIPIWPVGRTVTLVVGVNGVGKTTTIAKLTRATQERGLEVLLAAGDTFRAAGVEQLELWGERLGVPVIRQPTGADAAAVVFDALQAADARQVDHLIVDTAGRLHTKSHLMDELAKIHRVIERQGAGWTQRTVLVLDATTGHNAVVQAREFSRVAAVDGVILTKLDGTAKGGMAVAVARDLRLPVLFLGVGEGAEDLVEFSARDFAAALFQ